MEAAAATAPQVQRVAMAVDMEAQVEGMEAQVEGMEAKIHTAAAVRAPHMAAMEAARTLTAATAVEAATAKGGLLMERTNPTPLTALSQALVAMAAPEARAHHILVVTATAATERAPLHSTEAKQRALAMAVPVASHPMVAMEAPHQGTARPLATVRPLATEAPPLATEAPPLAMEAPHLAMARAPATARAPAMEAPHLATARAPALATVAPL